MSRNPYVQVALTYVRRPFASWQSLILCLIVLAMCFPLLATARGPKTLDFTSFRLMSFIILFLFFAIHVKDQFADSRAHLMPGFRRVHIITAAVAALVVVVVLPAMFTWYAGLRSVGFTAVAVLLFGSILWLMFVRSAFAGLLMLAAWLALLSETGRAGLTQLVSGSFEPQAIALLLVGIVVTLLAGIHLVRLNEDMPAYHTKTRWGWSNTSQMDRQAWAGENRLLPGLGNWLAEQQMKRLTRLAQQSSHSWWSRACRWQVAMPFGWSLACWILGGALYMHGLMWWIGSRLTTHGSTSSALIGMTTMILCVMPGIAVMGAMTRRASLLSYELMLPVDRRSYVRQLGTAAFLSLVPLWIGSAVAVVAWWSVFGPQPVPTTMLAGAILPAAGFQIAFFGIMAWTLRFRSRVWAALFMGLLIPVAQILQVRWFRFGQSPDYIPPEAFWAAGGMALFGLLITYDAYRRWLVRDFD